MLDILCVGDSKLDIFLRVSDDNPNFSLNGNKLTINHGEKIYVEKHVLDVGGNATNTAVGISRLGFNVGLLAEIGKDEFSQKILNKLKKENVNVDFLIQTPGEETSFSVALGYKGDRTIFSEHAKRKHNFDLKDVKTTFIYLTSMGPVWELAYGKILDFVKTNNIKLAFNPGTLQIEKRDRIVMDVLEKADYLFVNKQEAEKLLYGEELNIDLKNEGNIKKLLFGMKSLGVKNVIITDSDKGSYLEDKKNNIYKVESLKIDIVEKTGAGDAYATGFLAAVLGGEENTTAMQWGTVNAASVIEKIGAEEGLLTKQQLDGKIKILKDFNVNKIA